MTLTSASEEAETKDVATASIFWDSAESGIKNFRAKLLFYETGAPLVADAAWGAGTEHRAASAKK